MNRIKELREKRSLSQRQFVTDFNKFLSTNKEQYKNMRGVKEITFGTASRWENNLNKPTEYMWQALANFFNVSVDYLKGYMICSRCGGVFIPESGTAREEIKCCPYCMNPYFVGDSYE